MEGIPVDGWRSIAPEDQLGLKLPFASSFLRWRLLLVIQMAQQGLSIPLTVVTDAIQK
jgi:hypothetical protein